MKIPVILLVSLAGCFDDSHLCLPSRQSRRSRVSFNVQPTASYWRSYKWGWYGAKRTVKTSVEANEIILQFYVPQKGIHIHRVIENPLFYQAEIINSKGVLVDKVIIDKRTGRIRSIY